MFGGAISSDERRQSASMSDCSQPLIDKGGDAGRSPVCEHESCADSPLHSLAIGASSQQPETLTTASSGALRHQDLTTIITGALNTLKRSWFWYSIAASLCWTAWAFTARLGSEEIPPATMQFVSAFGFLLVGLVMVAVRKPQLRSSLRGNSYALISGILLGLGGIALYGAYRTGDNASVVTATTSLYPVATVLLAVTFLRETLNKLQLLGVCFAVAAILMLSS
jgi:bacterial/archaeal transporter family protein